ncbi:hypothetical protein C8Q79DRAFT_1049071 [Trametes meyenii]|nr:hypothetical protein C8Q79DRAFT_1049071 [Trametes meyenii]
MLSENALFATSLNSSDAQGEPSHTTVKSNSRTFTLSPSHEANKEFAPKQTTHAEDLASRPWQKHQDRESSYPIFSASSGLNPYAIERFAYEPSKMLIAIAHIALTWAEHERESAGAVLTIAGMSEIQPMPECIVSCVHAGVKPKIISVNVTEVVEAESCSVSLGSSESSRIVPLQALETAREDEEGLYDEEITINAVEKATKRSRMEASTRRDR